MSELADSLKTIANTTELFSARAIMTLRRAVEVIEILEKENQSVAKICIGICHDMAADGANQAAVEIGRRFGIEI